jgi:AraC-like DNA-binding protein
MLADPSRLFSNPEINYSPLTERDPSLLLKPTRPLPFGMESELDSILPAAKDTTLDAPLADKVFPYHEMMSIFNFYLDLECGIIPADNKDIWHPLRYHNRGSWPVSFEDFFGKRKEREAFHRQIVEKVMREKKSSCVQFKGLSTLLTPILQKGRAVGVLQAGVFLSEIPAKETLLSCWKEMSGMDASDYNPDFLKYVQTILERPLVDGLVLRSLQELLELYGGVLAGESDPSQARQRAGELKGIFARYLPRRFWAEKAVGENRADTPSWGDDRLDSDQWWKEEQGIEGVPNTILAVRIDNRGLKYQDDLDLILRDYRFQTELFKFSRTLTNSMGSPLEDYGMLFFTSTGPGPGKASGKLEILDKINLISKFTNHPFKWKLLTGVGRRQQPGEGLFQIYREAVAALEFCGPLNMPVLYYEEIPANPKIPKPGHFFELSQNLIQAYVHCVVDEIKMARNRFVEQILYGSNGRPEVVRLHFLYVFGQIVELLKKRLPIEQENFLFLFETVERQLGEEATVFGLTAVFRKSLNRLLALVLRPIDGSQSIRMEGVRKYIDENYKQDLKLEEIARENGFSVSVFGRGFKKRTGIGFSAYLRKVRLEQVKRLLITTHLPIAQISKETGFNNLQYFFEVFKRSTGCTPQSFRENARNIQI